MEEQTTTAINALIDAIQLAVVPLAVSGLAAWVSTMVPSGGAVMKVVDVLAANVGKARNDPGAQ